MAGVSIFIERADLLEMEVSIFIESSVGEWRGVRYLSRAPLGNGGGVDIYREVVPAFRMQVIATCEGGNAF
jgi:hypothetical protein